MRRHDCRRLLRVDVWLFGLVVLSVPMNSEHNCPPSNLVTVSLFSAMFSTCFYFFVFMAEKWTMSKSFSNLCCNIGLLLTEFCVDLLIYHLIISNFCYRFSLLGGDLTDSVTDAVHHRLSEATNTIRDVSYECYSCFRSYSTIEELAEHTLLFPGHSQEVCLKCSRLVTIFFSSGRTSRIHSCRKENLRHQNSDLHVLSLYLTSKLGFVNEDDSNLHCILCPKEFSETQEGIYKYLKHCHKYLHSLAADCRKCSLPQFRLETHNKKVTGHVCPITGKSVTVIKNI